MALKEAIEVDPDSPELIRRRGIRDIVKPPVGRDPKMLVPNRAQKGEADAPSLWEEGETKRLLQEAERRAEAARRLGIQQ
jgi:hypothetical protein